MQIVIDIDVRAYNKCLKLAGDNDWLILGMHLINAVADGTPLQKGHGRLFDERDIVNGNYEVIGNRIYELEPIIEADKAESEE